MLQYKIDVQPGALGPACPPRSTPESPPQKASWWRRGTKADESAKWAAEAFGDTGRLTPDELLERYLRYEEAARLEKQWTNERLGWLFTPQAILFTALGFAFSDKVQGHERTLRLIRGLIPLLGIAIALLVFGCVFAACWMHHVWTGGLQKCADRCVMAFKEGIESGVSTKRGTYVTFGRKPYLPARLARWATTIIPAAFLVAWGVILFRSDIWNEFWHPDQASKEGPAQESQARTDERTIPKLKDDVDALMRARLIEVEYDKRHGPWPPPPPGGVIHNVDAGR